jgi:two-component system, chemotaxis family, chemotaxis protein CheY
MKRKRVLCVDDEIAIVKLLNAQLREQGFETFGAYNGEEALKMAERENPDLFLLDLNMPKLDGLGLLRAVREFEPTKKAAFILVTGRGDNAVIEQGRKYGLNNFLAKPFTVATLKASIEAVVGRLG